MAGSHLFGQCGQVAQKRFTETRKICYTGSHLFGLCGQVAQERITEVRKICYSGYSPVWTVRSGCTGADRRSKKDLLLPVLTCLDNVVRLPVRHEEGCTTNSLTAAVWNLRGELRRIGHIISSSHLFQGRDQCTQWSNIYIHIHIHIRENGRSSRSLMLGNPPIAAGACCLLLFVILC